ncbi:MAG: MoaD/ThiS family protein [Hyphomicrobium sp.]|uniref:MoaD/ThiS family protein n=1 Tax=Hyphomicrobium sp. TaxID=82 RepID=UPI001320FC55|nr:MoaD/ThiS family protein [Hyphomicrobium sp.]KAB2939748.1 MAG: MoaD/ThiS family protein [Hyphomicrobium sp.]MBZ0211297.1 MoaD/ThiS family protein [Hyphomicrobium sp.]MCZ7594550.1 MoaD/ThiS family protein [Hyphomicrobium sp.]
MPRVVFTPNLQRHIACPPVSVEARTVREALEAALAGNARARAYVLDDQSALRKHMVVFVDGKRITDRVHLSDPVLENGEIYVLQALSGG